MSDKKNTQTKPFEGWKNIKSKCDQSDIYSPAQLDSLLAELKIFVAELEKQNLESDILDEARFCIEQLNKGETVTPAKWSLRRKIQRLAEAERLFDFKFILTALFKDNLSGDEKEQVADALANIIFERDSEEYLSSVIANLELSSSHLEFHKKRITEKLREIADEAYYSGEFLQAQKAYRAILSFYPTDAEVADRIEYAIEHQSVKSRLKNKIPPDALEEYYRYRSAIAANDLQSARRFLEQAIQRAAAHEVDFIEARNTLKELLDGIKSEEKNEINQRLQDKINQIKDFIEFEDLENAETAFQELVEQARIHGLDTHIEVRDLSIYISQATTLADLQHQAFEAIKNKNWGKLKNLLNRQLYLVTDDEKVQEIKDTLNGLHDLLRARNKISSLRRSLFVSPVKKQEVKGILDKTYPLPDLLGLWKEIDSEFTISLNKQNSFYCLAFGGLVGLLIVSGAFMFGLKAIFLDQRATQQLVCPNEFEDVAVRLDYPYYLVEDDYNPIDIHISNNGNEEVDGYFQVVVGDQEKIQWMKSNRINFKHLEEGGSIRDSIHVKGQRSVPTMSLLPPENVFFALNAVGSQGKERCFLENGEEFNGVMVFPPVGHISKLYNGLRILFGASGVIGIVFYAVLQGVVEKTMNAFKKTKANPSTE